MEKKENINEFINQIPDKLDTKKNISLYDAIKEYCPNTIIKLNNKITGKCFNIFSKKWYTAVINYLVKKEILTTEKTDLGVFHNVTEDYIQYFIVPKSTIYSLSNTNKHLVLYKQTVKKFLQLAGLLDENEKEIIKLDKKEIKISKTEKNIVKTLAIIILVYTIVQYLLMIRNYGIANSISLLLNTILLVISILFLVK